MCLAVCLIASSECGHFCMRGLGMLILVYVCVCVTPEAKPVG